VGVRAEVDAVQLFQLQLHPSHRENLLARVPHQFELLFQLWIEMLVVEEGSDRRLGPISPFASVGTAIMA
jgi:hypothetical protein